MEIEKLFPDDSKQLKVRSIRFVEGFRDDDPKKTTVWAVLIETPGLALAINAGNESQGEELMKALSKCKNLDFLVGVDFTEKTIAAMTKPPLNS